MKKEDRHQLSSSFKKGAIYEIDIVSLEPRFFLKYFKDISVNDVYMYIANKILNNSSSRKKIKLGMLATIHGAGYGTVKKLSGLSKKDYERIIDYFNVKKIKEFIKYMGISEDQFWDAVEEHRSPHIWKKCGNDWKLRHTAAKSGEDD